MSKKADRWLLFEYIHGEFTPLSKPFKTKKEAEKAREKYPERLRKTIGLGVIRIASLLGSRKAGRAGAGRTDAPLTKETYGKGHDGYQDSTEFCKTLLSIQRFFSRLKK